MSIRRGLAVFVALLMLAATLPTTALAAQGGRPTDTYCPESADQKHIWSAWQQESASTCEYAASHWRVCDACGYTQYEQMPKAPHTYGKWRVTKQPTCTAAGARERTCSVCGNVQKESIAKAEHTYGGWKVTKEATCTETGLREHTCSVCGHVEQETVARLPHTWGEWTIVVEATDHSAGTRQHTCAVCGTTESEDFDPEGTLRRGDRGEAVKALQEGLICYGTLTGRADGSFGPATENAVRGVQAAESLTADGVAWPQTQARLGHVFGDWQTVSELSDFSKGVRQRVCERCGYTETEEEWPAPMYRRGDKGDGVRALQEALNEKGYNCGAADGDFGGRTERAVSAFEGDNGLEADGIAWPGVLRLLGVISGGPGNIQSLVRKPKLDPNQPSYGSMEIAGAPGDAKDVFYAGEFPFRYINIVNTGDTTLAEINLHWELTDASGALVASGENEKSAASPLEPGADFSWGINAHIPEEFYNDSDYRLEIYGTARAQVEAEAGPVVSNSIIDSLRLSGEAQPGGLLLDATLEKKDVYAPGETVEIELIATNTTTDRVYGYFVRPDMLYDGMVVPAAHIDVKPGSPSMDGSFDLQPGESCPVTAVYTITEKDAADGMFTLAFAAYGQRDRVNGSLLSPSAKFVLYTTTDLKLYHADAGFWTLYHPGETPRESIIVANISGQPMRGVQLHWDLTDTSGNVYASGNIPEDKGFDLNPAADFGIQLSVPIPEACFDGRYYYVRMRAEASAENGASPSSNPLTDSFYTTSVKSSERLELTAALRPEQGAYSIGDQVQVELTVTNKTEHQAVGDLKIAELTPNGEVTGEGRFFEMSVEDHHHLRQGFDLQPGESHTATALYTITATDAATGVATLNYAAYANLNNLARGAYGFYGIASNPVSFHLPVVSSGVKRVLELNVAETSPAADAFYEGGFVTFQATLTNHSDQNLKSFTLLATGDNNLFPALGAEYAVASGADLAAGQSRPFDKIAQELTHDAAGRGEYQASWYVAGVLEDGTYVISNPVGKLIRPLFTADKKADTDASISLEMQQTSPERLVYFLDEAGCTETFTYDATLTNNGDVPIYIRSLRAFPTPGREISTLIELPSLMLLQPGASHSLEVNAQIAAEHLSELSYEERKARGCDAIGKLRFEAYGLDRNDLSQCCASDPCEFTYPVTDLSGKGEKYACLAIDAQPQASAVKSGGILPIRITLSNTGKIDLTGATCGIFVEDDSGNNIDYLVGLKSLADLLATGSDGGLDFVEPADYWRIPLLAPGESVSTVFDYPVPYFGSEVGSLCFTCYADAGSELTGDSGARHNAGPARFDVGVAEGGASDEEGFKLALNGSVSADHVEPGELVVVDLDLENISDEPLKDLSIWVDIEGNDGTPVADDILVGEDKETVFNPLGSYTKKYEYTMPEEAAKWGGVTFHFVGLGYTLEDVITSTDAWSPQVHSGDNDGGFGPGGDDVLQLALDGACDKTFAMPGETVAFDLSAKNVSAAPLKNISIWVEIEGMNGVTLAEDVLVGENANAVTPPGERYAKTFTYDIPEDAVYWGGVTFHFLALGYTLSDELTSSEAWSPSVETGGVGGFAWNEEGLTLTADLIPPQPLIEGDTIEVPMTLFNNSERPLDYIGADINLGDSVSAESWMAQPLEPGQSYGFTYTIKVGPGDTWRDWTHRRILVTAFDPVTGEYANAYRLMVISQQKQGPSLDLLIEDTTGFGGAVGETVPVEFVVCNNGEATLENLSFTLADGNGAAVATDVLGVSDPTKQASLAPGESFLVTYNVFLRDEDGTGEFAERALTVTAAVAGGGALSDSESFALWIVKPDETTGPQPMLEIFQTSPAKDAYVPGETIDFYWKVTNIGDAEGWFGRLDWTDDADTEVFKIVTEDDVPVEPNGAGFVEGTFSLELDESRAVDGLLAFNFYALFRSGHGGPVKAPSSNIVRLEFPLVGAVAGWHEPSGYDGALRIEKTQWNLPADEAGYALGETIQYGIIVGNNTDHELTEIEVYDPLKGSNEDMMVDLILSLGAGEETNALFEYVVTAEDVARGYVENQASARIYDPETDTNLDFYSNVLKIPTLGEKADGDADTRLPIRPNSGLVHRERQPLAFRYLLRNTSELILRDVKLFDPQHLGRDRFLAVVGTLTPGEEREVELEFAPSALDERAGGMFRRALAIGAYEDGEAFAALLEPLDAPAPEGAEAGSGLTVEATETSRPENGSAYAAGETITCQIVLTNNGEAAIRDIVLCESLAPGSGEIAAVGELLPGESYSCEFSYAVAEADADAGGVMHFAYAKFNEDDGAFAIAFSDPLTCKADKKAAWLEAPKLKPVQAEGDSARALTGRGPDQATYALEYCGEHAAIAAAAEALLAAADTDEARLEAWRQAGALWTAALDAEYDTLAEGGAAKLAREEQMLFHAQANSYRALLEQLDPEAPAQAAARFAELTRARCLELYAELHTAPEARPDSLDHAHETLPPVEEQPFACQRLVQEAETGLAWTEQLCEVHSACEAALDALLAQADAPEARVEAWTQAGQLWQATLDGALAELYETTDADGQEAVAEARATFARWLGAREQLLNALYPDQPETVAETLMQAVRDRALDLCGDMPLR